MTPAERLIALVGPSDLTKRLARRLLVGAPMVSSSGPHISLMWRINGWDTVFWAVVDADGSVRAWYNAPDQGLYFDSWQAVEAALRVCVAERKAA